MGKGFWESDEEYAGRINQEANEKVIEESTGNAPSKGFWEDDADYRSRISQEANEKVIEESTGNAPSKGFWEDDADYRSRISQEANEKVIEESTGNAPSKGFWEDDADYRSRTSREANEQVIESGTGSRSSKGFFESESEYRQRLYIEAREIRAAGGNRNRINSSASKFSDGDYGAYSSPPAAKKSGTGGGTIFIVLSIVVILGILCQALMNEHSQPISTQTYQAPEPSPRRSGLSAQDRLEHQLVADARRLFREEDYAAALDNCNRALVLNNDDAAARQLKDQIELAMQTSNSRTEDGDAQNARPGGASTIPTSLGTETTPQNETDAPSQESSITKDHGASELLARVQIALGGNDKLSSIHDWRQEVTEFWEPRRGETQQTTYFCAPSTIRTESGGENKVVNFSDGESGWSWSSTSKNSNDLPRATAAGMTFHPLPAILLNNNRNHAALITPSIIELTNKFGDTARLTINLSTYLPEKLIWKNLDGATLEESYSDWRSVRGVLWWFQMTRSRDGVIFLREQVRDYQINIGISVASLEARPQ